MLEVWSKRARKEERDHYCAFPRVAVTHMQFHADDVESTLGGGFGPQLCLASSSSESSFSTPSGAFDSSAPIAFSTIGRSGFPRCTANGQATDLGLHFVL